MDLLLPAPAADDAVMPGIGLQVVTFQVRAQRTAEIVRRRSLAEGALAEVKF